MHTRLSGADREKLLARLFGEHSFKLWSKSGED